MKRLGFVLCLASTLGCDPASPPPPGPGVTVPEGACGRALFVIATDYQLSTSVSVVGWSGEMLSPSMLLSGSATPGLSVALSGDVVAPTSRTPDGRIVLVDRYPASVVSFLDPEAAEVDLQVNVQTGFGANPQDVVVIGSTAYVSRFEQNRHAGEQPFDAGSDLLAFDVASGALTSRVDLAAAMAGEDPDILPRPSRMVAADGVAFVLLTALSADFQKSGDARLAAVDLASGTVVGHTPLAGRRGCSALALSPDGARIAVACSGTFGGTNTPSVGDAGLVVLSRAGATTAVEAVYPAADLGGDPLAFTVAFAGPSVVLYETFGRLAPSGATERDDTLVELDLGSGARRELLRSVDEPFTLGDVRCGPSACGTCVVADAGRAAIHRLDLDASGHVTATTEIPFDDGTGLPPRYIGAY